MNVNRKVYNELRKKNARFQEENSHWREGFNANIKRMSLFNIIRIKYFNLYD